MSLMSYRRTRRAGGFSLIEVLVAMLVLAIGLLGLAALQAQGLRFNGEAFVRTQATVLAGDLIDRIRADRDHAKDFADADLAGIMAAADPNARICSNIVSITNELRCWAEDVKAVLPAANASITPNGTTYFDIVLRWADRDPREFPDGSHIPRTSDQCLYPQGDTSLPKLQARDWDAAANVCRVSQLWTVWP